MTARSTNHAQTLDLGLRALASVKHHGTSADPVAYELWYEHASGRNSRLSSALDRLMQAGRVSDGEIRRLHAECVADKTADILHETGQKAQAQLAGALDAIRAMVNGLAHQDGRMKAIAERLNAGQLDPKALTDVTTALIAVTSEMCDANRELGTKLETAQTNISTLQMALDTVREEALVDALTGLANRRAFDEQIQRRLDETTRSGVPLSLLMLDVDHFKAFNDKHGHPVGDQILRLVASSVRKRLEGSDFPARYGGEEFAVVCLGRHKRSALTLAEEIRGAISRYEVVKQGTSASLGRVTVSIGVATRGDGDTAADLIARADECLYAAKNAGRDRVQG